MNSLESDQPQSPDDSGTEQARAYADLANQENSTATQSPVTQPDGQPTSERLLSADEAFGQAEKIRALAEQKAIATRKSRVPNSSDYADSDKAIFGASPEGSTDHNLNPLERHLLDAKITSIAENTLGGMSGSQVVRFVDGSRGIYKPTSREPAQDRAIEPGSYYKRERAAYVVDKALALDMVPPTVIRTVNGEKGSLQQFVPGAETGFDRYLGGGRYLQPSGSREELAPLAALDFLLWNSDRKAGDFGLTKDEAGEDKVVAWDHGLCFADNRLKSFAASALGEKMPRDVVDAIKGVAADPERLKELGNQLSELLEPEEVKAFEERLITLSTSLDRKGRLRLDKLEPTYHGMVSR